MSIFGGLERALGERPPEIRPDETVLLEDELEAGVGGGVWNFRPYAVKLDADHQEVGDRRYLARQPFTDQVYANAWCAWAQSGGKVPLPDYPVGAV